MYINKNGADYLLDTSHDVLVRSIMCGTTDAVGIAKAVDIPIVRLSGRMDEITVYSHGRGCTIMLDGEVYNIGDDGKDFERFLCNLQTVFALGRLGR